MNSQQQKISLKNVYIMSWKIVQKYYNFFFTITKKKIVLNCTKIEIWPHYLAWQRPKKVIKTGILFPRKMMFLCPGKKRCNNIQLQLFRHQKIFANIITAKYTRIFINQSNTNMYIFQLYIFMYVWYIFMYDYKYKISCGHMYAPET